MTEDEKRASRLASYRKYNASAKRKAARKRYDESYKGMSMNRLKEARRPPRPHQKRGSNGG
jgi:hypothetical protein